MLDDTLIGHTFPPHSADVEAGRLRLFAKATGETRPEYCDEAAARAAGHPSLPAPPTFAGCLYLDVADPFAWYRELGVDLARVLHGAQSFRYFAPVHAGDRLTFASQDRQRFPQERRRADVHHPGRRGDQPGRDCAWPKCARPSSCAATEGKPMTLAYDAVNIGDALPPLSLPPLTRTTLALYAGASGDHNPMHIDIDFARAAGMPDVFAHGMLSMAWLGRLLTNWAPQRDLREFGVRFSAITHVGERIVCTGQVTEKLERDGERLVRVTVATANEAGEVKLTGDALIAVR